MTQTRKIFINVIASHARAIYALAIGLLTGRWALLALGHESYGLFGLVGGLIAFVSLFNMVFSNAVVRYFSVAIGEAQVDDNGLKECQRWFNVVLLVHIVVPVVFLLIGYPIGVWVVERFLAIPPCRVTACVWVFRFTCLSCLVGMLNVPFRAMYVAKQRIAELTIYSFATSTAHLGVLWYFMAHEGDWLVPMAAWYFLQVFSQNLIMGIRALCLFPECCIRPCFMFEVSRIKRLSIFAGWQFLGSTGMMLRNQGLSILINKYLGAIYNATGNVAFTISAHSQTFANEVNVAFSPAISTAYGAKDLECMRSLVRRCEKFSTLLVLAIALPLSIEMEYIVCLWLKDPPPSVASLAICWCLVTVLDKASSGSEIAINADGRIAKMQVVLFACYLGVAVMTWGCFCCGGAIIWSGVAAVVVMAVISIIRVLLARRFLGLTFVNWIRTVIVPVCFSSAGSILAGLGVRILLNQSFVRMILSCGVSFLALGLFSWLGAFSPEEKQIVLDKIGQKIPLFRRHK